jgi:hypothetical protein
MKQLRFLGIFMLMVIALSIIGACGSDNENENVILSGPHAKEWYFTITNGDENHRLDVGIAVLAPGETSPEFTLGNGGITKVRYWWHLTNGESEAAFLDIDMHNLPSGTKKNYVMKYN